MIYTLVLYEYTCETGQMCYTLTIIYDLIRLCGFWFWSNSVTKQNTCTNVSARTKIN